MDDGRAGFVRAVYAAYRALAEVRCHRLGPPGIKGLQEELLSCCDLGHAGMMRAADPRWPAYSPEDDDDGD